MVDVRHACALIDEREGMVERGDRSGEWRYIETVPKHGYRFIAEVTGSGKTVAAASAPKVTASGRSRFIDLMALLHKQWKHFKRVT